MDADRASADVERLARLTERWDDVVMAYQRRIDRDGSSGDIADRDVSAYSSRPRTIR